MRLMLSKDAAELNRILENIEQQDIGRDAWLAHRPDETITWRRMDRDRRIKAKCALCKGQVYWWANEFVEQVHCECTVLTVPPKAPHVKEMGSSDWKWIAGVALKGIQQWLATS